MPKLFFPKRIPEPMAMEEEEMRAFEKLSRENFLRWTAPLIDHALSLAPQKKQLRILDVGCGPGMLSQALARTSRHYRITGVDISPVAIMLAKKNCKSDRNTDFTIASIYSLPFETETFDVIICKDTFHHFDRPLEALREMVRALKQGGLLYIQDLRRDMPRYLLRESMPPDSPVKKLQYYSARASYTKQDMKQFLKKIPLKKIKVATRTVPKRNPYARLGIEKKQIKRAFQARFAAYGTK